MRSQFLVRRLSKHRRLSDGCYGFRDLKRWVDGRFHGRGETSEAILLAVVAGEHAYVEGPSGASKTALAETIIRSLKLKTFVYQFHRDTRASELLGDAVIERETSSPTTEIVKQRLQKGGLLVAEVSVLDEISRAPGEALNALLRALNERVDDQGRPLPLKCAVATSNPPTDEHFNEKLDPAALDRFAIHNKVESLIDSRDWESAKKVIR